VRFVALVAISAVVLVQQQETSILAGVAPEFPPMAAETVPADFRGNLQSGGTTRVGSYDCPECPYGLHHMSGDVWEWTRSPFQP